MKTTVSELPNSRARVEVEVDPGDVARRMDSTAERMGREMKVPGFRKGKVPAQMVLQRIGREAVLTEAIESSLADWYELALLDGKVNPVGSPDLDLPQLPPDGEPLRFTVEVGIRPKATIDEWKGLEVGKEDVEVPDEMIQTELERLREGFAKLNPVNRAAAEGDVVLIDYTGTIDGEEFEGGSSKDSLLEVGGEQVLPEFEAALAGAKPGDERVAKVTFPDDYGAEDSPAVELRGKTAEFAISVNEVREKDLPALDDDFASEASEFDTIAELRSEIADRIKEVLEGRSAEQFRDAALDVAAKKAKIDLPDEIVKARAGEIYQRLERQLAQRGINPETFLQMQGKSRDELINDAHGDAELALRREATLDAIAESEGIEITEEEMLEALQVPPGHEDHGHPEPGQALANLKESGREALLAEDLRMRRAMELIAEHAKPIPIEKAEARDAMWTPEKDREAKGGLWKPGDPA